MATISEGTTGKFFGMLLHEGQYLDPVMRDLEAFLINSQATVSGKVFVTLHPYRFELNGIDSDHDLMNANLAVMVRLTKVGRQVTPRVLLSKLSNQNKIYQFVNKDK